MEYTSASKERLTLKIQSLWSWDIYIIMSLFLVTVQRYVHWYVSVLHRSMCIKGRHTEVFNDLYRNDTSRLHARAHTHTHTHRKASPLWWKHLIIPYFFPSLFSFSTHGPLCWLYMYINKQMHLYRSEGWRSPLCKRKSLWCCSSTSLTRASDINHTAE